MNQDNIRVFKHFNSSRGAVCPVCNTSEDCETVLVSIPGTERDNICEAMQVHKKCYDLIIERNRHDKASKIQRSSSR